MVYSQTVMNEGTVKQWCRIFKDSQINVHNEEQSVMSDNLVQNVEQKVVKKGTLQFQNFHANFHKFQACSLYDYHRLDYCKFSAKMDSEKTSM
jgi:hypothetical protein